MNAQISLSNISANRDLWIAQYRKEISERDQISSMAAMLKEGLEKGIEQGKKQKAIESAKIFLKMGLTAEQVAQGVGLPIEEVIKLL